MQIHPWRSLRHKPHIDVVWTRDDTLLAGADAWWYGDQAVILMDARLRQTQRRCALAHELAHEERGDTACNRLDARQELAADLMAARWLIELGDLLSALKWTRDKGELADELWVTRDLLQIRLDHLHPAEKHHLRKGLDVDPR